jgi:RNA polymerase sigma-70 factor (ECF subfamily)
VTTEEFARAVQALPEDFRTVFRLQVLDGHPYDQIAALLHIPTETVSTRLRRARILLGAALLPMEVP